MYHLPIESYDKVIERIITRTSNFQCKSTKIDSFVQIEEILVRIYANSKYLDRNL